MKKFFIVPRNRDGSLGAYEAGGMYGPPSDPGDTTGHEFESEQRARQHAEKHEAYIRSDSGFRIGAEGTIEFWRFDGPGWTRMGQL